MSRAAIAVGVLGMLLAGAAVAEPAGVLPLQPVVFAASAQAPFDAMIADLARADVVFVGEDHDDETAHALELRILTALYAARPKVALGMEMFERDVQLPLDEYLAGQITEQSFLQCARPWPNYRTDYRPLVEFCRENHLPVIATNAPRRYVSMVARDGPAALDGLSREAKRYLPRLPVSPDIPAGYKAELETVFTGTHATVAHDGPTPANMIAAQELWDATMADSIARFRREHRDTLVLHINGAVHSDHGWGIVDRLRRLMPRARVEVVSLKPDPAYPAATPGKYDGLADYVILTPPKPSAPTAGG